MKIAALSLVYNEEKLIKGCVKSLEQFVDAHVMVVGDRPYFGRCEIPDRSAELAEQMGCEVIKGSWALDHYQRNAGIALLNALYKDIDWIICTDVDMWLCADDMKKLLTRLQMASKDERAFVCAQYSYWKDINHILVEDDFKPVIAIRPDVRFNNGGCIDANYSTITDKLIHHLAWCEPKDILKKVTTYTHAKEFDGAAWYKSYYQPWVSGDATLPTGRFTVKEQSLPDELRRYLE